MTCVKRISRKKVIVLEEHKRKGKRMVWNFLFFSSRLSIFLLSHKFVSVIVHPRKCCLIHSNTSIVEGKRVHAHALESVEAHFYCSMILLSFYSIWGDRMSCFAFIVLVSSFNFHSLHVHKTLLSRWTSPFLCAALPIFFLNLISTFKSFAQIHVRWSIIEIYILKKEDEKVQKYEEFSTQKISSFFHSLFVAVCQVYVYTHTYYYVPCVFARTQKKPNLMNKKIIVWGINEWYSN